MQYSEDLSNVKPGDIRLVQFCVGPAHPLYGKKVAGVITRVINTSTGLGIEAKTLKSFIWPYDSEYYILPQSDGSVKFKPRKAHRATHEGWVETTGHLETQGYPVRFWASRYKDGHIILTTHKPVKRGDYWVDDLGPVIPVPRNYFPDITFTSGPKEVTYKISKF